MGLIGAPASVLAQETVLTTNADVTILGGARRDSAGTSVSGAGDVNGDGIDDLIIGAFSASPKGRRRAGASYVVFGAAAGLPPSVDLATDADLVIQGDAAGDYAGRSVSGAGDVNGDGIDDLLIGAPHAGPKRRHNAGAGYVVFGAKRSSRPIDLAALLQAQGPRHPGRRGGRLCGQLGERGRRRQRRRHRRSAHRRLRASRWPQPRRGQLCGVWARRRFPAIIDLASDADLIIQGAETG